MQLVSVWFREACLIKTALQTVHQPWCVLLSKTWNPFLQPWKHQIVKYREMLSRSSWLLIDIVAGFPDLFVNSVNTYWQPVIAWYLITQMETFWANFFQRHGTEINLAFYMIREIVLSLSMCGDPCESQTLDSYRFNWVLNLIHIYCIFHSICWMM